MCFHPSHPAVARREPTLVAGSDAAVEQQQQQQWQRRRRGPAQPLAAACRAIYWENVVSTMTSFPVDVFKEEHMERIETNKVGNCLCSVVCIFCSAYVNTIVKVSQKHVWRTEFARSCPLPGSPGATAGPLALLVRWSISRSSTLRCVTTRTTTTQTKIWKYFIVNKMKARWYICTVSLCLSHIYRYWR